MFAIEAVKYNVFPLDDRLVERFDPARAGRPILVHGNSQLLFPGMGRLSEHAVLPMKNVSYSITAEVTVVDSAAEGVIIAQGGRFGGWSLYAQNGRTIFAYNYFGLEIYKTEAQQALPSGTHQLRAEFTYEGGGVGKGGTVALFYDNQEVGRGRIPRTQPLIFSAEESTDIGYESGSLVTPDYATRNGQFTGRINWVRLDVGRDNFNHLIKPEERLHMVMTRQ
jgi:arylsulfatase